LFDLMNSFISKKKMFLKYEVFVDIERLLTFIIIINAILKSKKYLLIKI
jgi:hypothetical protein